MKHQWETYRTVVNEFEGRKKRYEKRLPTEKVEEIVVESLIDENKHRFERWFWYSVGIYIALLALAVLAVLFIPGVFGAPQILIHANSYSSYNAYPCSIRYIICEPQRSNLI